MAEGLPGCGHEGVTLSKSTGCSDLWVKWEVFPQPGCAGLWGATRVPPALSPRGNPCALPFVPGSLPAPGHPAASRRKVLTPKANSPSNGLWVTVGCTGSGGAALLFVFVAFGDPLLH